MKKTNNITTTTLLRMVLLLLMMSGANGVWGQVETSKSYYLEEKTYSGVDPDNDWVSDNTDRYTTSIDGGGYVVVNSSSTGDNGTRVYTNSTNVVTAGVSYILQFDIKIKGGTNQASWFQVNDATNVSVNTNGSAASTTESSILQLAQTAAESTTWRINGSTTQEVTLATDRWYTFKVHKTFDKTFLTITDKGTDRTGTTVLTGFNNEEITTNSTVGGLGRMEFATKRYYSQLCIDNVSVMKWGWDVPAHTVALTNADNDNKITGMPTLYNPESATVGDYTYDGTVLGTYDKTYPPRIKATGQGTVRATIGGKTSQYTLNVTSPTGGGTYDAASHTYTFDQTGVVSSHTVDAVPGVTMTFNGGQTAVVVNDGTRTVLKVIDGNGFSHPNLNDGQSTIPPEANWGGTFYKFVPSANGKLSITGNFDYMKLYESNGTTLTASANTGTERNDISLEIGKTYYLYNAKSDNKGSNTPLLHSFKFVPDATTLTFRNPQPVITVDVTEGSYTNPAISAVGLPVSYEILSGPATVDSQGKVSLNSNQYYAPTTVVVKASTAASGSYAASAVSYTINFTKRTWIFDDKSQWTTSSTDLGTGWETDLDYTGNGLNGTKFCRETQAYDATELKKDGINPLPETQGLLITKAANNDRLYIAPKDYSTNFLAIRASQIFIPDVQAGQTVIIDWYGGNSQAVLDIADAGEGDNNVNVTSKGGGVVTLNVGTTGRVRISSNPIVCYIRSIKVSNPTRAIGTLTYAKTVLNGTNTENRTGYTITDEAGTTDLRSAYSGPGNFQSSNTSVATVDASGNITAVGTGTAIITATAAAKNSTTHQASVTLVALIEVVSNQATRIRTIDVDDLLYTAGSTTAADHNRTIPGFTLSFTGSVTSNTSSSLTLSNGGKMTISPRVHGEETVTITQALVTVKSVSGSAAWKVNDGTEQSVTAGGITLSSLLNTALTLEATGGAIEISDIKLYYQCSNDENADFCLDDTKLSPTISFDTSHYMRVPADGREFSQTPTLTTGKWFNAFDINYIYSSSATGIATIGADGTNGQLLSSGNSTITATFNETAYFASATATYTVSNTLLPGENYEGISMGNGQFIHIQASANAENTDLTLTNTNATTLTFGPNKERRNTYASSATTTKLTNNTNHNITIYWIHVVTKSPRVWLYYAGQEENYMEQVQFQGFPTGPIAGFRVMDVGDPYNPIDLTDAYSLTSDDYTITSNEAVLTLTNATTGDVTVSSDDATVSSAGTTTISHSLTKTGQADGYDKTITATAKVTVLPFSSTSPYVWDFVGTITNADNQLGQGWTYDDRGFQYGYFSNYMPILKYGNDAAAVKDDKHGIMLKDEFRWYPDLGLRANLSQVKSSFKFPVKKGMEIDIYASTSSADITHSISNVTDINGKATDDLFIQIAGEANPIHNYYLAAEDGVVEVKSTDKVGMYLKSITLKVPEIHFTDDIVTVLTTGDNGDCTVTNAAQNVPTEHTSNLSYAITSASLFDDDGNEEVLTENYSQLATIDSKGIITLAGKNGWFEVTVTNTAENRTALEPVSGTYKVYVVDFKFDPSAESLNLDSEYNKEVTFNRLPRGINKVVTPINYSFEASGGAKALLRQSTNTNPALTTYSLTAYNKGTIDVIAETGRIKAVCTLTITGHTFEKVVDALSESDITDKSYVYSIQLPNQYNKNNESQWRLEYDYQGEFYTQPSVVPYLDEEGTASTQGTLRISNLYGNSATERNHGAIRVRAFHGTDYAQFVLTLAYPAKSGKKWDFYRSTGLKFQTAHDNKIGDYEGTHQNAQTISDYTITGSGYTGSGSDHWTTNTSWEKVYRNGEKEPRWAYSGLTKCDNAFIVEETAGLMIETPKESFYVDNNSTAAYTHIGLHSRSTITIPRLKNGDFVRLNMSRVIPNKGAILKATNVTDLAGTPVTENFTITRSQIDYREDGVLATDENGSRIIPGYYTFIAKDLNGSANAHGEFDVSFTLADEGHLDVLSVEIYDASVTDLYLGTRDETNGYQHTMLPVKLSSTGYPYAPTTLLKENEQQEVYALSFCHPMWSTSVGPANYELRGKTNNLNATLEKTSWYSAGGAYYEDGHITVNQGYGKITVRMNNYTADRKYLIGYTPDYTLTVGHLPHQEYPYTWNFTNISGGTMKGRGINAFYSVWDDGDTWTDRGDNTYELNTDTEGGSFYIPGSTLVSTPRDLGMNGSRTYLSDNGYGLDEFNGLGFSGQFMFKTANQHASAPQRNTTLQSTSRRAAPTSGTVSLLEYRMDNPNYTYGEELAAGNGTIKFGANKREAVETTKSACGYGYKCDGDKTSSKYIQLTPMRPFAVGDVIQIKAFSTQSASAGISIFTSSPGGNDSIYVTLTQKDTECTITYTVKDDDCIKGKESVYLYRYWPNGNNKGITIYINEVSITGSYSSPTTQSLYTVAPTVVTIPDLNAGGKQEFIYIHASKEPTTITNATKVTGTDNDADTDVYKYRVTTAGNSNVTFSGDTEIYQIGVTHLFKPITKVGTEGWATESRDVDIDYTLTDYFTTNNPKAYVVENATYTAKAGGSGNGAVRVSMGNSQERKAVPHGSDSPKGLVLRQTSPTVTADYTVPLFVPAVTTALDAASTFSDNLMAPAVSGKTFGSETEGDNTVFILAKRYMTWKKEGESTVTHDANFASREVAAFYRLHYYDEAIGTETANKLNTLEANKAYLLLPTEQVPDALWKSSSPAPRRYIAIEGVSDMEELEALEEMEREAGRGDGRIYNLNGQAVGNDEKSLPAGIYVKNGKKFMVK